MYALYSLVLNLVAELLQQIFRKTYY